jgi:archaellum component FlaG (FlaF/FlaG flagellin family)
VLKLLTVVHNKTGVLMDGVTDSSLGGSWILKNGVNGVVLRNTSKCMVGHNAAIAGNGNGTQGYGVWIKNSGSALLSFNNTVSTNFIDSGGFPGTQVAGVWVGSSNTAPVSSCSTGTPSTGNTITNNQANANGIVGIGLECGTASGNVVSINGATGNIYDGADGTVSCTGDTWSGNAFSTKYQPCD